MPHLLTMTATPIPRTLALTLYGDLDISILNELPAGRKKIISKVILPSRRNGAYEFIREQVGEGRQAFVICPRIEPRTTADYDHDYDDDYDARIDYAAYLALDTKAVKAEYERLSKEIFPDLRVGMLHGKLKSQEKESVMKKFAGGQYDILVSTSVVEVGIDVPNAAVMMIEAAEKFGLAQLHQFRGRVGRGEYQSYCLLFTESNTKTARERLEAFADTTDGFALAEKDLKLRGPGEFFGERQSGLPDLAMRSLKDLPLVQLARQESKNLLEKDPQLKTASLLKARLEEFQKEVHLE